MRMSFSASSAELDTPLDRPDDENSAPQPERTWTKLWHAAAMAIGLSVLAPVLLLTLLFAIIPAFVLILPFLVLEVVSLGRKLWEHFRHVGMPGHEPAWSHSR